MNMDDLLGTLMSLFEKKVAFQRTMQEREATLKENNEARKIDLEYKRLDAQVTDNKDKNELERWKVGATLKGGLDLEAAKNAGMITLEGIKGEHEFRRQKYASDTAAASAKDTAEMNMMGKVLEHQQTSAETTSITGEKTKTSTPSALGKSIAEEAARQRGYIVPPDNSGAADNSRLSLISSVVDTMTQNKASVKDIQNFLKSTGLKDQYMEQARAKGVGYTGASILPKAPAAPIVTAPTPAPAPIAPVAAIAPPVATSLADSYVPSARTAIDLAPDNAPVIAAPITRPADAAVALAPIGPRVASLGGPQTIFPVKKNPYEFTA
jgi:hypothetical protein